MLLIYKNKGILIAPYFIGSLIGTAVLAGVLKRNVGGVFSHLDFYDILGFSFIICALLTYFTKNDYCLDRNGQKQKIDIPNEFFFLKMDVWVYIFCIAAAVFLGNSMFGYFGKQTFSGFFTPLLVFFFSLSGGSCTNNRSEENLLS